MEELIQYVKKTFDEPTLKIVNFLERANILVSEMKMDQVKEGDRIVNKPSPNMIELSYLRLCDEDPDFPHNMMGEVFLHYLEYVLRDVRANWRVDTNRLNQDLNGKCVYCNIPLKSCPMKVLGYIKKCIRDASLNEQMFFFNLMQSISPINEGRVDENDASNIADKVLYLCKTPIDLRGAEFLLDTDSVKITGRDGGKIYYQSLDFELKKISFINNLHDYFVTDGGNNGSLDMANPNIATGYSYMFDHNPVELAVAIKDLCENANMNYHLVFNKIYTKLGKFENISKLAYYKEYIHKLDSTLENNEAITQEVKEVLTYIRNYDKNAKLPYIKFDFLIYTNNSQILDNIVSILNKYCRTYNYLSSKNITYVDVERFIMRSKDSYDVISQLERIYNENDFIVFANIDKATNINEYRLEAFFQMVPKLYNKNPRAITIFSGEKKGLEGLVKKYDAVSAMFGHVIDTGNLESEIVKEKICKRVKKVGSLSSSAKNKISEYVDKNYRQGAGNEAEFIEKAYEAIVYDKYKAENENDEFKPENIAIGKQEGKLEEALEKLNKLVGVPEVKTKVNEIMRYLEYQRKIGEEQNINCNMVFKGNVGTGKTTVTKIMAEILYALGVVRSNKVIEVTGKDLIGSHLGETGPKTGKIVKSAVDGILVINEANTILASKGNADFPLEAVTSICEGMDRYKDRLVVILSGDTKEMSSFLSKYSSLSSRIGFEIGFDDFSVDELAQIFKGKLEAKGYTMEEDAFKRVTKNIERAKIARNFTNARYVDNLFEKLILAHSCSNPSDENLKKIVMQDVDNVENANIDRDKTVDDILKELNSLIGLSDIKKVIDGFVSVLEFNKKLNRKSDFNMHMIFKGNAGTGKTTVARLIANIYYSLGYINKNKVVEVQSQDLIAEWLGQTGPKTQAVIESALDGVLFIDEAYSLMEHRGSNASYTAEAIATLLKAMEDYKGRLIVIFAGYTEEMMQFRDLNPGLKSRIGFELTFTDYTVDELVQIFEKKVHDQELEVDKKALKQVYKILEEAKKVENFGNGRFVDNMVQKVIIEHAKRLKDENNLDVLRLITEEDISNEIKPERSKNKIGF
ncbi:MAG: AAA family ATPase [Clostridia bacterium]|nr:AAA family ATPase [Clostridia bacterium]